MPSARPVILPFTILISLLSSSMCAAQQTELPSTPQPQKSEEQKIEQKLVKVKDLPIEWLIGPYIPSSAPLRPLTLDQRWDVYYNQTFLTAGVYVERMFTAGIDQARGSPSGWGGGMSAYGKRFGNRYGIFVISNTFHSIGNAALGYETRYDLCRCSRLWPRTKHAIARNFVTYNRTEVERRPAFPLYVGSYGAGMVATAWLPGRQNVWKNGAYAALGQAGWGSAYNWVSEFAADILRTITKQKYPQRPLQ